ncbi:cutinase [Mycolicibacterium aromaticivorans JS19b1 = JCM 16368]|uniref:Cutinase n=1 Tax=Mycolicibacterium aromaticivorans JS19b1 = JCM 16368 TaxID=1440774 RepID=A0A064CJE0_9MYCO|nr:cutinase family protein [Mycolicibacterium aromaticivorans]KDE98828.1 cutinase [Mycolicibacterium aromaticivorans JS19b1 = JCM 16368]
MATPTMTSLRKLGVASIAALAILPPIVVAPAAQAAPCPDVEVVFARGTSEPAGIGRVGQALADSLQSQLGGRTVSTYGVDYPASYDFLAAADGATDATNHIAATAAACPSTRFVLGGYSQGAAVVDMLVGIPPLGNKVGEIGSAPPLPGNLANRVAGLAVFGNPSTKFGIPITSAGGTFAGKGVDFCNDGDPICSRGRNPFAHTDYEQGPAPAQAAGFLAGLL